MKIFSKEQMESIFSMKDAILSNKEAFKILSNNESNIPLRTNIDIPKFNGQSLFMCGYIEKFNALGVKVVSVFPNNTIKNLAVCPAQMILLDGETGFVKGFLDGTFLTAIRTGASTGVATQILSRKDAKIGALIGTGGQSFYQLEAMLEARPLSEIRIFSRDLIKVNNFISSIEAKLTKYNCKFIACSSSDEAINNADIITVATTSKTPVFNGDLVKAGAHINGIGSYTPNMQEVPESLVKKASIFTDSLSACISEAGDLIIPLNNDASIKNNIKGEIGEVLLNKIKGRETDNEITFFKSVGSAVLDLVAAHFIYEKLK